MIWQRLQFASNDYHRLLVRYWQRNVGKDALARYAPVRDEIAAAIVEAVSTAPDEDCLIVTYKDSLPYLRQSVAGTSNCLISSGFGDHRDKRLRQRARETRK
jgi:hypothetical protein